MASLSDRRQTAFLRRCLRALPASGQAADGNRCGRPAARSPPPFPAADRPTDRPPPLASPRLRRMTIAFFCLAGLELLGGGGGLASRTTEAERRGWIDWVWSQQMRQSARRGVVGPRSLARSSNGSG